jgi:hypothetical protein
MNETDEQQQHQHQHTHITRFNNGQQQPAEENRREFTDEQLRAGDTVINLQYGTNRGANQSGLHQVQKKRTKQKKNRSS